MKKLITREIELDDDGVHCGKDCMFLFYNEITIDCNLYNVELIYPYIVDKGKVIAKITNTVRCKECLEENPEKILPLDKDAPKEECKHCWHTLPYYNLTNYNLTNPPQGVEICCWCGAKKTFSITSPPYGTASWTSKEHGPHYNIRPMY